MNTKPKSEKIVASQKTKEKIINKMKRNVESLELDATILKSMGFCLPSLFEKIDVIRKTVDEIQY